MRKRPAPQYFRKTFTIHSAAAKSDWERESAIDYALTIVLIVAIVMLLVVVELAVRT